MRRFTKMAAVSILTASIIATSVPTTTFAMTPEAQANVETEAVQETEVQTTEEQVEAVEAETPIAEQAIEATGDTATEQVKLASLGLEVAYGKGTAELVSGLHSDDVTNYPNGYYVVGEEVILNIKPDAGWQLGSILYFNKDFAPGTVTPVKVDGVENQYKFVVPDDTYAAGFYGFVKFAPILEEGQYEVELNNDGISSLVYDVDKLGAKAGETVTITMSYSAYTSYGVPTVADEAGNAVEVALQSITIDRENNATQAVYTFTMPVSKVIVKKNRQNTCEYTLKTTQGFETYASLRKSTTATADVTSGSIDGTIYVRAQNEIDGKYYKHIIAVQATQGSTETATAAMYSVADGYTYYRVTGLAATKADVNVQFEETTSYTISNTVTELTGAKFTLSNSSGKAAAGDVITMTLAPTTAQGYYYNETTVPTVTDAAGNQVEVVAAESNSASKGVFTFTMPAGDVTIALDSSAITQRELKAVTVEEDSKAYIATDVTEARSGNRVYLTLTNTDNSVKKIKIQFGDKSPIYYATTQKYFTMQDENVVVSVVRVADSWLTEGNYDAELYGSNASTWNISDGADFAAFAKKVQAEPNFFEGKTINITRDIDLSAHEWEPIILGDSSSKFITVNGNGKTISGITIENCSGNNYGLFASIDMGFKVTNLNISGKIKAHTTSQAVNVGTLFGYISYADMANVIDNVSTEFTIEIDGAGGSGNTMSISDIGCILGAGAAQTIINSSANNTITVNQAACGQVKYGAIVPAILSKAVINNNNSNSTLTIGEAVTTTKPSLLCGIAQSFANENTAQVNNNYFGGTITSAVDAEIYGITQTLPTSGTLSGTNYAYVTPLTADATGFEDSLCSVDENNKSGKVKLTTLLNGWVDENNTTGTYLEWEADADGKPVHKAAAQSAESYELTTQLTGSEYGELTVDDTATAGSAVTIYATAKPLCVLESLKVVLASSETTELTTKNNGDGTYTFYMPGEAVKVIGSFKQDARNITLDQAGEGTVEISALNSTSNDKASAGDTVTVKIAADKTKYFVGGTVTITAQDGTAVEVTPSQTADNAYTFIMPEQDVTVRVAFEDVSGNFNEDGSLKDGSYKLPVAMMNASNHANASMAASCVVGATLTVKDGKSTVTLDVKSVSVGVITAWGEDWKVFQANSVAAGTETVVPATHTNEDGKVDQLVFDLPGTTAEGAYQWGGVYLGMYVDAMGMSVEGWFAMDFAEAEKLEAAAATPQFGSAKTSLPAGTYTLPISMMRADDISSESMAASCVKGAALTVAEDGTAQIEVALGAVTVFGQTAWAADWKVYQTADHTDTPIDAKAVTDADGHVTSITFAVPDNSWDGIFVNMNSGRASDAYFALDYANAVDTKLTEAIARLQEKIDTVKAYKEADYTAESFSTLQNAITEAEKVVAEAKDQQAAQTALAALEAAEKALTKKPTDTTVTTTVAAPTTITATATAYNKVKITWNKVSDATGYEVYRTTANSYKLVKTLAGTTFTNTGLVTGTKYTYQVRAYKMVNGAKVYSSYTKTVSAKPVLSKAKSLKVKNSKSKTAVISWKKVSGASGYEVYRSTKKAKGYAKVATLKKATKVSYTNKNLKKGKTYYYKVRAYRTVNGKKVYSAYTSVKAVKIKK